MYEEKAEKLFKAYINKEEIEPFEVNSREEAENIFKLFTNKLISYEGLEGYKISLVTPEALNKFKAESPDHGVLTSKMIVKGYDKVDLLFKYSYAEVEVVVFTEK